MHIRSLPLLSPTSHPTLQHRLTVAVAGVLAIVFTVGHVALVRTTLDGIDSTNFALAIDGYDPRLHQPHPPGFPVHVALGRVVAAAYRAVSSGDEHQISTAATSLRIWSAMTGALTIGATLWVAMGVGLTAWRAAVATALLTLCPLFWITAMRPLSDVPGLLFAMTSQALALAAYNRSTSAAVRMATHAGWWPHDVRWLLAAGVAGVAVGVRVQTSLLTLPLLCVLTVLHGKRAGFRIVASVVAAFLIGVMLWAVPLVLTLGGPGEYLRLLTTVAADDVEGVEMLATRLSPALLLAALSRTLIVPWGSFALGSLMVVATIAGAIGLLIWNRRVLGFGLVLGVPYLAFHLAFQETASIRYALPLVPVTAILIVGVLKLRAFWIPAPIIVALLVLAARASANAAGDYARTGSPVARAINDAILETTKARAVPALASHHAVGRAIRAEKWAGPVLPAPVRHEWLAISDHWLKGSQGLIWFLADARRTDLALVDPTARRLLKTYQWPGKTEALLGGIQPPRVNWYEITPPGWFLTSGWSLTPETHGVSIRDGRGPGSGGAVGYIKRRLTPALMLIGGRNLGGPCETAARIDVLIDGRPIASWTAASGTSFLQHVALDANALAGEVGYAELKVVAGDVTGAERGVDVVLEQFDVQSAGAAVAGLARGWYQPELDPANGSTWRWMEEEGELHVESFGRDAMLSIRGESPLRFFQGAPQVIVKAGTTTLATFRPTVDFDWKVHIPAAVLASSKGRVTITSDRSFVPHEIQGNDDRRRLALRIYSVSATVVSGR